MFKTLLSATKWLKLILILLYEDTSGYISIGKRKKIKCDYDTNLSHVIFWGTGFYLKYFNYF